MPLDPRRSNMMFRVVLVLLILAAPIGSACSSRAATPPPVTLPTVTPVSTSEGDPASAGSPENTDVSLDEIAFGYVTELSGLGPRASGTEQEAAAARYLVSQFSAMGYSSRLQPFSVELFSVADSGLTLSGPESVEIEAVPLSGSASGNASGVLVPVGLATDADFPTAGLKGKIALIRRGRITFQSKVDRATEAGAAGVVIYNNRPGNFRGALPSSSEIPVMSISGVDGERIEGLVSEGDVEATLAVVIEMHATQNVVAEAAGTESRDNVIAFGAHYDTVPNVVGASDNASGTAVLLTLARQLSTESLSFGVRFIAFGSEELGLRGSQFYVDSLSPDDQRLIVVMMNFDALGDGDRLGVLGTTELADAVVKEGVERGIDVERSLGLEEGGSDHESFAGIGVPVIFFFSDDFSRIHTPQDTLERINARLLGDATRLALDLTRKIGAALEAPALPASVSGFRDYDGMRIASAG